MSTVLSVPAAASATQPVQVTVSAHPSRWIAIMQAITSIFEEAEPIAIQFVPPKVAAGLAVAAVSAPIAITIAEAVDQAAGS